MAAVRTVAAVAIVVAVTAACQFVDADDRPRVAVGMGGSTEQRVLAALTVGALAQQGFDAQVRTVPGGTVALRREALGGEVDLFWDYTGAAWALGLREQGPPADPEESYQRVRREDEGNGLTWLAPSEANATLALFVRGDAVPQGQAPTMRWLAGELSAGERRLCADADFLRRPGGMEALALAYDMNVVTLARGSEPSTEAEAVERVAAGACFAGLASATSGTASLAGLVPVTDDLRVFPAFVVAPVVRSPVAAAHSALAAALAPVAAALDTATLAALNADVEAGTSPEAVARAFLRGLPTEAPRS